MAETDRIRTLRRKLAARETAPGNEYKESNKALRAEIARLEEAASGPEFKL